MFPWVEVARGRAGFSLGKRSSYLPQSRAQKPRERVERGESRKAAGAPWEGLV